MQDQPQNRPAQNTGTGANEQNEQLRDAHNPFKQPVQNEQPASPQEQAEEEQQRKETLTERD
jgi:hypothetical protein